MEAGVVVNFLNFFADIEEEEINFVLDELQTAGLSPRSVDLMVDKIINEYNYRIQSGTSSSEDELPLPEKT